jgi:CubicO group peptidase (beta-lactamase class C family)/imidazolonepropionase-like amidohydrolase
MLNLSDVSIGCVEKNMRYHLVFCLVIIYFSFVSVSAETAEVSQNLTQDIEAVIQPYHKYGVFNGSVLIAKGNKVIYQRGFGYADNVKNINNTPETAFRIASLSKTFTALLIMQLFEEKKLSLAERLHKILPEYSSPKGQEITIRQLLDHTSGLPRHFTLPGWNEGRYQSTFSRDRWLQIISQLEVLSEPAVQYQYSNLNYFLLGCVIEKLTGMSYQENLHKRILQPSNMHSTDVDNSGKHSKIQTQGYRIGTTDDYQIQSELNMQVFFAGANVYSTVVDLFKFEQALFSGTLLKKQTLDFWLNKDQAFAWQSDQLDVADNKPMDWLAYSGQLQGFSSMLSVLGSTKIESKNTQNRFTIIILSNSGINYGFKQQLTLDLSDVLLGLSINDDSKELPIPATFLLIKAALQGTLIQQAAYLLSNADKFVVNEQDINQIAQQFLWAGAIHKATVVWELNTLLFPNSDNARNKLKEVCENKKLTNESVKLCRKHQQNKPNEKTPKGTLIINITIVSPELSEPLENHDVYIVDDKIVSIGKGLQVNPNLVINGTEQFLTPGLIDAHTHLNGVPGMSFEHTKAHPKIVEEAIKQIPKSYLYHGFTTVIDLHSDGQSIANWNQQSTRPKAYFCGAAPVVDGYPMNFLPKPFRYQITPYFLLDGEYVPKGIDPKLHTPQAVVAKMSAEGAICVKTHYESGFGGRGDLPTPSLDLIRQLKAAASAADLPLLLHANSQEAQKFGINANVDVFVHGMWTWNDRTKTAVDADISRILDAMIAQKVALRTTIQVLYGERDVFDPRYLDRADLAKVLTQSLINWYKTPEGQGFRTSLAEAPYVQTVLKTQGWESIDKQAIERVKKTFAYIVKNGGKLSFGSDTPSDLTFANPPGLNGRFEMKRWQQAGVTAKQFLAAATIDNAKLFNLQHLIGSVQVGKRADLLILKDNPLTNIDAFNSIESVISAGKVLPRATLAANN